MTNVSFNPPLYKYCRSTTGASFQTGMFGWRDTLTPAQTAEISLIKRVIYHGFKAALQAGAPKQNVGILVDEQRAAILRDAMVSGYSTACAVEKSGANVLVAGWSLPRGRPWLTPWKPYAHR